MIIDNCFLAKQQNPYLIYFTAIEAHKNYMKNIYYVDDEVLDLNFWLKTEAKFLVFEITEYGGARLQIFYEDEKSLLSHFYNANTPKKFLDMVKNNINSLENSL